MSPALPTNESESISEPPDKAMFCPLRIIFPDIEFLFNDLVMTSELLANIISSNTDIATFPLLLTPANVLMLEFVIVRLADETVIGPDDPVRNPDPTIEFLITIGPELVTVIGPAVAYSDALSILLKPVIDICEAFTVIPAGVPGPS